MLEVNERYVTNAGLIVRITDVRLYKKKTQFTGRVEVYSNGEIAQSNIILVWSDTGLYGAPGKAEEHPFTITHREGT